MRRMTLWLSLFVALVLAVVGAVPAAGQVAEAVEQSSAPDGLRSTAAVPVTPDGWQSIQTQVAKLTADDGVHGDDFGRSVSVGGDTVIVGAVNYYRQAAYIFYRDEGGPGTWGQVAKLTAKDGVLGDDFGGSVSVSGDTAVVGAQCATVGDQHYQGKAYVF